MQHDVCALSDLSADGLDEVEAGGVKILLARDGERVHATGAFCTHKGAPLKNGTRVGDKVVCPFHHAIFELSSGRHLDPPGEGCLQRFETVVAEGRVLVEVPEGSDGTGPAVDPAERRSGGSEVFAIVGAGAGGYECAKELVRLGFDGRIVLFGTEPRSPYDRTALSKTYLAGKEGDDDLPLAGDGGLEALGIEHSTAKVTRIDRETRSIYCDGEEDEARLVYDRCFVATGSEAATIPLPGADLPNVLTLRDWDDAGAVKAAARDAKNVVVIGSGFIGMEAAAAFVGQGKAVTVVSLDPLPFARLFGDEVAGQIVGQHREKGVDVRTNSTAAEIVEKRGAVDHVRLEDGSEIEADLVLMAVGAKPRVELLGAEEAVEVGEDLSVDPSLFAGGDIASFPLSGRKGRARIEHWRVAAQHGRHAAAAMMGTGRPFTGVPFFWSAQYGPIHYVGHAESWDEIHVDGDLESGSYTAFYIQDGAVVAALGRGKADTTADLHAVMLTDRTPSVASLQKVDWQPKALLKG